MKVSPSVCLALIKPGSGRTLKYQGLLCFDLAFTRFKFTRCVIEQYGLGNLPRKVLSVHLERDRERIRLRTRHHRTLLAWDQKLIGILIGTAPDCGGQPMGPLPPSGGLNSSKTKQKGGQWGGVVARLWMIYR
jgi:hypothetical protein